MAQIYAEYIYEVNIIGVGKKKRICTYYFGAYKPRLCKLIVLSRKWNQVFIHLRAAERISLRDPPPPRVYSALLPHERNACIFSTSEMHPRILTALNAATAGTVNKTVTILSGESLCRASLCGWGKQEVSGANRASFGVGSAVTALPRTLSLVSAGVRALHVRGERATETRGNLFSPEARCPLWGKRTRIWKMRDNIYEFRSRLSKNWTFAAFFRLRD